jgi:hypothetical protein
MRTLTMEHLEILEYLCLCTDYTLALCVNQLLHC